MNAVYEIIWKYPSKSTLTPIYVLKVCDYLETEFTWLCRDEVVSMSKSKVQKTADYLTMISPDDYEFIVVEANKAAKENNDFVRFRSILKDQFLPS